MLCLYPNIYYINKTYRYFNNTSITNHLIINRNFDDGNLFLVKYVELG